MVGTVSNIVKDKGFGFIMGDNGQEYFFHMSEVPDSGWIDIETEFFNKGKGAVKVTFEPVKTPKGPRAKGVVLFQPE